MKWLFISPLLRNFAVPITYIQSSDTLRSKGFTALDCAVCRCFVIVCDWRPTIKSGAVFYCPPTYVFGFYVFFIG